MNLNNLFSKEIGNLLKKEGKGKIYIILTVLGILGIFLIFVSEIPSFSSHDKMKTSDNYISYARENELEKRLEKVVSKIEGVGKASVMLTLDSSPKYYYAVETNKKVQDTSITDEEKFVLAENDNNDVPIVIKIEEANVRGVVVICEGGDSARVREKVIETLCAVLKIKVSQVSVAKMA